jgi:hypothetical protein
MSRFMGRGIASAPLDVQAVQQAFALREDGRIIRASTGEVATFVGPGGRLLVRVYHAGTIRRIVASRLAWCLSCGSWPKGVVRARNSVDDDLRFENLILTKAGPRPFDRGKGGEASSLERRAKTTTTLINALAANPGSTVPVLSKLIGSSVSCCCTRLGKLADMGLTCGPKCDARARWDLTPAGRAVAHAGDPVVLLDDLDKRVLRTLALAPKRQFQLAPAVEVCPPTIKRRTGLLIGRGLGKQNGVRQPFSITDAGLAALDPSAPTRPAPWVSMEMVSAAAARDVRTRLQHPNDDRSSWARAEQSSRARQRGIEKARENRRQPFIDAYGEWSRTG